MSNASEQTKEEPVQQLPNVEPLKPWTAAKRLHDLLLLLRNTGDPTFGRTLSKHFLPMRSGSDWDLIQVQSFVARMIQDTKQELSEAQLSLEEQIFYSQWLNGVCVALGPGAMILAVAQSKPYITDADLVRLQNVDMLLRDRVGENELTKDVFSELLTSVEVALVTLSGAKLPKKLKDLIVRQLLSVKLAIEHYRFLGIKGLEDALAAYMGSYAAGRVEKNKTVSKDEKVTLKRVLDYGQSIINLAKSTSPAWPYLVAGAHKAKNILDAVS